MKVASIILTVLSFISLPLIWCLPYMTNMKTTQDIVTSIVLAIVAFALLGYVAHILIARYRYEHKGGTFLYVITFPAYILPFVTIFIIWALLSLLDQILYVFFDRYLISEFLDYVKENLLFTGWKRPSHSQEAETEVYVVYAHGSERQLALVRSNIADYQLQDIPNYDRFVDDLGNYWRSYDNHKTFVSEEELRRERGSLL